MRSYSTKNLSGALSKSRAKAARQPQLLWGMVLLILLRFGSSLAYSVAIPTWESYDEPGHFGYAVHIATTGRTPQLDDPISNNERIQPPLYYYALAVFLKVSQSQVGGFRLPQLNPYFYYGTSGKNYAMHPDVLPPDQQQVELALRAARMISLLFSLIGVVFVQRAARLLWPRDPWLVLIATAVYALWPQSLFSSAVLSNDSPAAVMGAIVTYLVLRFHQATAKGVRPALGWALLSLLAIMIGIGVKLNLLVMFAPLLIVVLISASLRLIVITVMAGAAAALGSLFVLTQSAAFLFPFASGSAGPTPLLSLIQHATSPDAIPFIRQALSYSFDSAFGLFGWGNVAFPDWLQTIWQLAVAVAVIGLLIGVISRRNLPSWRWLIVLVALLLATLGGTLTLALLYQSIHLMPGRYLLPALPAFSLLLVIGWSAIRWPRGLRIWRVLPTGATACLVILALLVPPTIITPAYAHPLFVDESAIPDKRSVALGPGIEMLGYRVLTPSVYVNDSVQVEVYWRSDYPIYENYTVQIEVIGPDGQGYGILDTYPGDGNYPTTDWMVGQPFKDHYGVRVRSNFPTPGVGHIKISVSYNKPATVSNIFGAFAVNTHDVPSLNNAISANTAARFGDHLLLRDAQTQLSDPHTLAVNLLWQASGAMPDGTVFVHVVDPQGVMLAQKDTPPLQGAYPTSAWLADDVVSDSYNVMLPTLPAGLYTVQVGVYDAAIARWPLSYSDAHIAQNDILTLTQMQVDAQGTITLQALYPPSR